MQDKQFSQDGVFLGSSHSEPSVLTLPADDDAGLLALDVQFHRLVAEVVSAQKANNDAIDSNRRLPAQGNVEAGSEPDTDREDQIKRIEEVLARLHPIEQAIMATPARTITGLGVKARHAAYVVSHYWEAPIDQIDWDARAMRSLIEADCLTSRRQTFKLPRKSPPSIAQPPPQGSLVYRST